MLFSSCCNKNIGILQINISYWEVKVFIKQTNRIQQNIKGCITTTKLSLFQEYDCFNIQKLISAIHHINRRNEEKSWLS